MCAASAGGSGEEISIKRPGTANLRKKRETTVAKVIEFYIPNKFRKIVKWTPSEQRGKVIEIAIPIKKSA